MLDVRQAPASFPSVFDIFPFWCSSEVKNKMVATSMRGVWDRVLRTLTKEEDPTVRNQPWEVLLPDPSTKVKMRHRNR